MPNARLAGRYAKSLLDLAIEQNQLDTVHADMKYFQAVCTQSPDFVNVLRSPIIKADQKNAIVLAVIKDAKETADKMVSEAKDKAKQEYERIISDAQLAITQQKNAALTEVKNQVGSLVVEVAEKILRKELSNKAEQESYIKQIAEGVKLN